MALYSVENVNVKAKTTYAFSTVAVNKLCFPETCSLSQLVIADPDDILCLWMGWQVLPSI